MRVTGRVRWFDRVRAFGVIDREPGQTHCIVRHAAMRGTLCNVLVAGEQVEFEVGCGAAGAVARDVVRVGAGRTPASGEAH